VSRLDLALTRLRGLAAEMADAAVPTCDPAVTSAAEPLPRRDPAPSGGAGAEADLIALLVAFPGAEVERRPPTPIPDEPKLGDWVWRQPLPPRRRKWR
jgi:hypothetical protein